jgi:hypothetical protein
MVDDSDAAGARSLGACCLKVLAGLAHESPDPDVRAFAWKELGHLLVMLRRFLATPGIPDDARQDALATLRGFHDA